MSLLRYLVWREESDRTDARHFFAYHPAEAAEKWAEWSDSWYADYTIVGGTEARVFVALDEDGSDANLYEVRGEPRPSYNAKAVA